MIAGLEEISTGDLYIDGELINNVAPKDRDIAMVFQSYALYPQMTVYKNMSYALQLRKVDKEEIDIRVREAARILKLTPYLERRPRALSGGQRQRVALGRAIVRKPKVFLMDEPLSNLDAKLRVAMRSEIVRIHEEVGATTIYVTHDQIEAMTMASRIVVMKDGFIQQIGKPNEIYRHPANMFVAGFIGTPAMNFLHGEITDHDTFKIDDTKFEIRLTLDQQLLLKNYVGKRIVYGIRPENLIYEKMEHFDELKDYVFEYTSTGCELLGDIINVHGRIEENPVILKTPSIYNIPNNSTVRVAINPEFAVFFNETTTKAITPNNNQYEEVERSGALYDDNITIVEEEKTGIVNFIKKTIKKVTNKKEDNKEEVKEDSEE